MAVYHCITASYHWRHSGCVSLVDPHTTGVTLAVYHWSTLTPLASLWLCITSRPSHHRRHSGCVSLVDLTPLASLAVYHWSILTPPASLWLCITCRPSHHWRHSGCVSLVDPHTTGVTLAVYHLSTLTPLASLWLYITGRSSHHRAPLQCQFPGFISVAKTRGQVQAWGTLVHLHHILASYLNTCVEYVIPEDRLFGSQLDNGSWTGVIGLVIRKEVDMSGIVVNIDAGRMQVLEASVALYINEKLLSYKRPGPHADLAGFLKPFTATMWSVAAVAAVVVVAAVAALTQSVPSSLEGLSGGRGADGGGERPGSWTRALWQASLWTVSALLGISSWWWPRGASQKVVATVWLLGALVISAVYRSNLMAMLVKPSLRLPFNTLEELLHTKIPCYVTQGTVLHSEILGAAPGSQLYRLRQQMVSHGDVLAAERDTALGIQASFSTRYAVYNSFHKSFSQSRRCPLYTASETFFSSSSLCLVFPKGSTLLHKINIVVMRLREAGVLEKLYVDGVPNASRCGRPETVPTSLRPLQLADFYGVLSVCCGGLLLASLIFLLEMMSGVCKHEG
ncbi:glutamate [NMDA] receptor subunit 1-like [Procambarus clarkii]|uniref:glutamate [NMDA] receptor subunit 1-like n=1 Tax=Procambarus clarkii TaxID=6728 RepID=UPI00374423F1